MPLSLSPVIARTPFDIGVRVGELARPVSDTYMQQSSAGQAVHRWHAHPFVAALLRVLGDRAPEGLPIYRDDPADPDDENTLATAVFAIRDAAIDFTIHQHGTQRFATRIVPSAHARSAS
ncbi:hypothetical protein BamMEX5DRAFT_4099 [Burkholderia ambifaria MEX-5]|uniref:Uncharacterized protein n=1 Tax=Burkholderia ambifaria MEX-5 TaxID=396597 RepID=B1T8I3_9BURK|nr:hypothetical protein BamMEX5DRAFT_4099 [Burkholderia ambifaria MEX-5]